MLLIYIQICSVIALGCYAVIHADTIVAKSCVKPKCFVYEEKNATTVITVSYNSRSTLVTTFCFKGLPESLLRLWVNPVLQITRNPSSINDSSKFASYYGVSVSDVEKRSQQQSYRILQEFTSRLQPLKQTDDLSLDPFNLSCLRIDTNVEYTAKVKIKAADLWYIAYLIIGTVVFFSARSWSHNTTLHYGTGVSVGVIASVLIFVFIVTKFLPSKLKNIGYILMLFGGSVSLWFLSTLGNFVSDPFTDTLVQNWQYVLGYIVIAGVLSFALVYRYGPVTDERSLSLIQWFLQLVGLVLVYNSTQIREVSIALVLILLAIYNFPKNIFFNDKSKSLWYRFFPPKIQLLTEEEYIVQGNTETKRELDKLREYCRSPDCQAWKVISKLKSPHRFAEFITKGSWHVSEKELNEHEISDDPALVDSDAPSDTESDLVFVLGSPSRTVRASFTGGC